MINKYAKQLFTAAIISLTAINSSFAADVTTEAEFTAALANVGSDPTINIMNDITLTSEVTLPDSAYTINGNGFNITTYDGNGFNSTVNVTVDNLLIDTTATYIKNSDTYGGAIFNSSNFTIDNGAAFSGNTSGADGGAIYNETSDFTINGDATFTNNTAGTYGGAIFNGLHSTFTIGGNATFSGNTSINGYGGAIENEYSSIFTIDGDATFSGNSADGYGGAIENLDDSTFTIGGDATFSGNTSINGYGGAIESLYYSDFTIGGDATFSNNTAYAYGGAINNEWGSTSTIGGRATFLGNTAIVGSGGAIDNYDNSTFIINKRATFTNNTAGTSGGAIDNGNNSDFTIDGGATFSGNTATSDYGGAIYNYDNSTFIINKGATFTNNTAGTSGGAIYSDNSITTLIAGTNNVLFDGNTAGGVDNAIYLANSSVLNLNASTKASVIFNDAISSDSTNNVININATNADVSSVPIDSPTVGEVILNADMSGYEGDVNLYGGTLSLGSNGTFFDGVDFMAQSGSTLNLINNKIDTISLGAADIDNMNLNIDVDLNALKADTINAASVTNNDITISGLTLIKNGYSGTGGTVTVDPNDDFNITLGANAQKATGNVYVYNVSNNGNGTLNFAQSGINPVVQASSATQQSAHINIANTNNIVFGRADDVMGIMDAIKFQTGVDYRFVNKVAALEGEAEYSTLYGRLEKGSVWFRPFNSIEDIDVDNMESEVDSASYGALVGFDSPLYNLGKGRKGMWSLYGGFSGANQDFSNVDLYQNGGLLGIMGALYKRGFYTALSANVGGYGIVEKIAGHGSANYGLFTTSVASKTGYNFHLPWQTVLQLNNQLAYSFVSTQDYTNAQGTRIDSEPLHVIQLVPGVKVTKNIRGWQPYLAVNMAFNPLNKSKVRANDVVLPETSLGSYVEYGVGIQNYTEKLVNGFIQVMVRNGSRTGVNFKFGLKVPVGKKDKETL